MAGNTHDNYNIKRNLYYYLHDEVLQDPYGINDYVFNADTNGETLTRDTPGADVYNSQYANISLTSPIEVLRNGLLVDPVNFSVNYRNGYIQFESVYSSGISDLEIITWNVKYVYFDIRSKFSAADASAEDLPIITIGNPAVSGSPHEIGSGITMKRRVIGLSIYARDEIELDDITCAIMSHFDGRNIAMINYRREQPLDNNGFINTDYVAEPMNQLMSIDYIGAVPIYSTSPNHLDKFNTVLELEIESLV